ncbi:DUF6263 family protein [Maribacter algicola]|uniref:DUF6263 family protein n=1 Tax=Meishania litoralis TaxID=3434685 RepID=A0ACC7LMS9_9FLAO
MRQLALIFFIVCNFSLLNAQTKLQYDLKKDDVFVIKQRAEQLIVQELDGVTHEITNKIDGVLEFSVVGEVDDNYQISLTFKDLNLQMASSLQGQLMDVKAKEVVEGDMQSQIFNSLLETPVSIILAKTGDILEVKGGDSLVNKMARASGIEDEFSLNMMKSNLKKEFGSEALSNNYKQMTYIYSTQEIDTGSTWENQYSGKLEAKNKWVLDSMNDTIVRINGTANVTMNVEEAVATMKLNGTQETAITADRKSGFIQKMTVTGLSKGTSVMSQMGDTEIPTTIKSTITYELIKE